MRRDNLHNHGEHERQHQARAHALDNASGKANRKRVRKTADQGADQKRTQGEQRDLASGEPLHQQAGEGQYDADGQHVADDEPLHERQFHAKGGGKLRQGDIQRGFAVHSGETAQVKAHKGKVGVRDFHARFGECSMFVFSHC